MDLANTRTNHAVDVKSIRDDHEIKFKQNHGEHLIQTETMRREYDDVVKKHEKDVEMRTTKYLGDILKQKDDHDQA